MLSIKTDKTNIKISNSPSLNSPDVDKNVGTVYLILPNS